MKGSEGMTPNELRLSRRRRQEKSAAIRIFYSTGWHL